ncbi:MAG: type III pantothenate kinase [Firmicutes bacterium]|nr:type III pantothenate kinase [Bacillota bacterium]MBQ4092105.1 type III pantothenate kinase [Bacillota bacterium]
MLLTIDVGNTHTCIGAFEGDELRYEWRIASERQKTEDEIGLTILHFLDQVDVMTTDIEGIVIGSVVPVLTEALFKMSKKYFSTKTVVVNGRINWGIDVVVDNPAEVGADRIADGLAAYEMYGGPVIVVDFGTGTTFDYITEKGEYSGGVIAPGIGICIEALFSKAAKLSKTEYVQPPHVVGTNTTHSMQSGFYYGFAGQVDGILSKMIEEIGRDDIKVVATGGLGRLVERESKYIDTVEPHLTLYGLKMLYERN